MAANPEGKWQELLPEHPVFQKLAEDVQKESEDEKVVNLQEKRSKHIFVENDGEIFIWASSNNTVVTANLKNLHFRNERKSNYQVFTCTEAPLFEVTSMLFSSSSKYLALIGERGVSILEIPRRWGKFAEYDGGSPSVLCRTIPLDERFFVTHVKIRILDVKWHPGSQADVHLVVLTSDNNLRIYNALIPNSPEELISLGESSSLTAEYSRKSMLVGSLSSFAAALGEAVIAFDFGPAMRSIAQREKVRTEVELAHSIFILRENGDMYHLVHTLSKKRRRPQLTGPLTMHPAADDNYGQDACSLLCLHLQPPVIAMATSSGRIYHCIVLESGDLDSYDPDKETPSCIQETPSWNRSGIEENDSCSSNLSLFVIECIELQLSFLIEGSDSPSADTSIVGESIENDTSSTLRLQRDPGSPYQYHCTHSHGVHSVALPWAEKLQDFSHQDDEDEGYFDPDEGAVLYHMICTSPKGARSAASVLGLCVIKDRMLGSSMLCLTSKMECVVKPLSLLNRPPSPILSGIDEEVSYGSNLSPIKHLNVGLFRKQIEQILTRNTSTPLLRADESSEKLSQEECYRLLTRAQEILRREYIQKQIKARNEIEKRISILKDQKQKQSEDLEKLKAVCTELQGNTERLGEKLVNTSEKHEDLLKRLEAVFQHIHAGLPVLSHSESDMKQELQDIEGQLKFFKGSLQQINAKEKYHFKSTPRKKTSATLPAVNANQQNRIRKVLCEENEIITDLVNQVRELKLQVGL